MTRNIKRDYCPYCNKIKWGYKKRARWVNQEIEWFICFDCEKKSLHKSTVEKSQNVKSNVYYRGKHEKEELE